GANITITATGSGAVSQAASTNLSTSGTLAMSSLSGTIGTSLLRIVTNAANVTANTLDNVFLNDTAAAVTMSSSSPTVNVLTPTTLALTDTTSVTLTTNAPTLSVTASGNVTVSESASTVTI